ncbi:exonuclease SbcC [Salmonella bongori]|nr:exonuclease SbcC [Salmonella bongori]
MQEEQALTEAWQTLCAALGVQLQPLEDLSGWLAAAEEHEQQLYQLSQRHALQSQIAPYRTGSPVYGANCTASDGADGRVITI